MWRELENPEPSDYEAIKALERQLKEAQMELAQFKAKVQEAAKRYLNIAKADWEKAYAGRDMNLHYFAVGQCEVLNALLAELFPKEEK